MATEKKKDSNIVYSTDHGKICPACNNRLVGCICRKKETLPLLDGIVRVGRERKGRRGKGVTVISGVPLDYDGLLALAKQLKQKCGTGGTVKDGIIEIQGDHRDVLIEELKTRGYSVRRSGA
jgi:translation initiation factor 1